MASAKAPTTEATLMLPAEKEKLLPWSAMVCIVYCAVVGFFIIVGYIVGGPLVPWTKPDPEELWHCKTAVLLVFSSVCTEMCFIASSFATVKVIGWNLSTNLQVHTLGDSLLTFAEYAVKVACGVYLYHFSGGVMHADSLALGGPRPVYMARFAQWSVCVPILVLLGNRAFLGHCTSTETLLRSAPVLGVSCIYCWAAWLMEVTPSHFVRWPMFFMSMMGFVVMLIDQFALAYQHRSKPMLGLKIAMLLYEAVTFTVYSAVFAACRFGMMSSWTEQTIYAYSDATVKVFSGTLLAIIRHRNDLHTIKHWWVAAQMASQDLETLIHRACLPVFGVDLDGRITFWNGCLETLTGKAAADMKSRLLTDIVASDSKDATEKTFAGLVEQALEVSQKTAAAAEGGKVQVREETHATVWGTSSLVEVSIPVKDGEKMLQLAMSYVPKSGDDGHLKGFMAIGQDLSEVSELKYVQARKSALMAMLSHEIRSPLHGIMGLSGALVESEAGKTMSKQLGMIRACADRLLDLVTNIMFMAHQEKEKQSNKVQVIPKDPVCFATIVDEVMTLTKGAVDKSNRPLLKPTVKLVNELSCKRLPFVPGDRQKCTQMLYNLLTNACKFTDHGSITIAGRHVADKQVLEIDVTDTGRGISEEGQKRIFQPFEQETNGDSRSFQGIGLGLSVVTEIAGLHKGHISLQSKLGKGSTFTIVLPCDGSLGLAETVEPTLPDDLQSQLPGPKVTGDTGFSRQDSFGAAVNRSSSLGPQDPPMVLSVDDDEVNQEVVKNALEAFCQVEIAMDGKEALAFLKKRKRENKRLPDIVLLDIQMPGMTGYEVCEHIRKSFEAAHMKLPVIMVSARAPAEQTAIEGYETGMTDFLAKPFNSEVLRRKVQIAIKVKEDAAMGASMVVMKEASQKMKEVQRKYDTMEEEARKLSEQVKELQKKEEAGSNAEARAAKAEVKVEELEKRLEELRAQERNSFEKATLADGAQAKLEKMDAQASQERERADKAEQKLKELQLEVERLQRTPVSPPPSTVPSINGGGFSERAATARAEAAEQHARELKQQVEHLLQQHDFSTQQAEVKAQLAEQLQQRVQELLQHQDLSVSAVTKQADARARDAEARAQKAELRAEELSCQLQSLQSIAGPMSRTGAPWSSDAEIRARDAEAKADRLQKQLLEMESKTLMADHKAEQWQQHAQQMLQQMERPGYALSGGLPPGSLAAAAVSSCRSCAQLQRHLEAQAKNFIGAKAIVSLMSSRMQMMGKVAGQCRQILAPSERPGNQTALERAERRHSPGPSGRGRIFERAIGAQLALLEHSAMQSEELATLLSDDGLAALPNISFEGREEPWGR